MVMDPANVGTRVTFRQATESQMIFSPAFAFQNKTASAGTGAVVEAIYDGSAWVLSGDLDHVPSGFVYSSSCVAADGYDAAGTYWSGYWISEAVVADGSGGTYNSTSSNVNGCWYPQNYVINLGSSYNNQDLYWVIQDYNYTTLADGYATYYYEYDAEVADGNGSYNYEYARSWQASYGYMFTSGQYYDSNSGSYYNYEVYSDGSSGYYVNTYQAY